MSAMTLTTTPITVPAIAPLLKVCDEEPELDALALLVSDVVEGESVMHDVSPDSKTENVADWASRPSFPPVSVATREYAPAGTSTALQTTTQTCAWTVVVSVRVMSDTGVPPDEFCPASTARSFVALMVRGTELFELYTHVKMACEQVLIFDGGVEKTIGLDAVEDAADAVEEPGLEDVSETVEVVRTVEETGTVEEAKGLAVVEMSVDVVEEDDVAELEPPSSPSSPSPS